MSLLTPVSDPAFYALSHGTLGFTLVLAFSTIFLLVKILQQPIRIFEKTVIGAAMEKKNLATM